MSKAILNVDELISYLEDNLDIWKHPESLDWAIGKIKRWETADAHVILHGEWIPYLDGDSIMPERYYQCNHCGRIERRREPYCHCGRKMDL